jgi:endonuclease III
MTRPAYSQAYETAKLDLLKQLQKRDQIDKQILKLKQTVKALGDLCGAPPDEVEKLLLIEGFAINSTMGFTEAIRRLFRMHQKALNPVEIRDDLLKIGIGREQVNLLSSIHTVLRRMVEAGEIEKTGDARFQLTA